MTTLRSLLRAARDRFARPKDEPQGPIGREDTVWGRGAGVRQEDQAAWEWLYEDVPGELEQWADGIQETMPHLPADVLEAFRRVTRPDEWIYAIHEPEASYGYCYRFWPHRATDSTKWYVSPVPDGDDEYFVSQDFSWGLLALFGGFPRGDWQICPFGQRFLDALAWDPPAALSTVLHGDAFSQGDPEERAQETEWAIVTFKLGLNCALAQEHGLWTRGMQRQYRKLERLEADRGSRSTEDYLHALARFIAHVEAALDEAGVEYEPATSRLRE